MGIRFRFELDGVVQMDRELLRIGRGISNLDEIGVWEAASEEFYEIERDHFQTNAQGDWAPWSPAYEEYVWANFPFPDLMRRSQRLYLSLTRRHHADAVYEAGPKELTLGTRVPYARAHMRAHKGRPARPPVDMTREEYRRRLTKAIQKKLVQFMRETGRSRGGYVQRSIGDFD